MNARRLTAKKHALPRPGKANSSPLRVLSKTQRNKARNIRKDWMHFTGMVHLGMIDKI